MIKTIFKKRIILSSALAAVLCLSCVAPLTFGGCESDENHIEDVYFVDDNTGDNTDEDKEPVEGDSSDDEPSENVATVEGLVIPLSEFTTTAKFYGVEVSGTYMEIIAVKYGSSYRTAFNTCQVCYGSSKAYFKQSGNYLVCQNCGSRFSMSQLGVTSGSCNPYPILSSDRVQTEDSIIIPDSFLITCKNLFKNWRGA